jgi:exosortase/archaeosortase family protein
MTGEERRAADDPTPPPSTGGALGRRASNPVLRFVVGFLVLVGLFQLAIFYVIAPSAAFDVYLNLSARAGAFALGLIGQDVTLQGSSLVGPELAIEVRRGCDGLAPASILASAVLAFPGPARSKALGLAMGLGVILVANVLRISSLFLIGLHLPEHFDQSHHFTWPVGLIVLAMLCWMAWVTWLLPKPTATR